MMFVLTFTFSIWFPLSLLMQFFSGSSTNSGFSGVAVLCMDSSAFVCSCGDADAVRTSTSFSKHHCWTHNHSKECPLCRAQRNGVWKCLTLISQCLENPSNYWFKFISIHLSDYLDCWSSRVCLLSLKTALLSCAMAHSETEIILQFTK